MDIELNAPVVSSDGTDLGKIDKVIFDPASGETKSIVVRKGLILGRDVAVSADHIRVAAPSRVELDLSREEVDSLPDFFESDYTWPPQTWVAPYGWASGGVLWPSTYPGDVPLAYPPVTISPGEDERLRQIDEENAVIGCGAAVLAKGGEKVGSVHNVLVDPKSHRPSSVVLRRGMLFTDDVELPGEWVDRVDDERVMLNVDKVTVESLAKRRG
jgi:uncharacterized protein YrrD